MAIVSKINRWSKNARVINGNESPFRSRQENKTVYKIDTNAGSMEDHERQSQKNKLYDFNNDIQASPSSINNGHNGRILQRCGSALHNKQHLFQIHPAIVLRNYLPNMKPT